MASFEMVIKPHTSVAYIQQKLRAFRELYEDSVIITVSGQCIEPTSRELIFSRDRVPVTHIGRKYLCVEVDREKFKVDMTNPRHGITTISFLTQH